MRINFDRHKCLQELEHHDWGKPKFDSHLVQTCHRLRRTPLEEFKTEDLRIMIGQHIGLPFLIPLALETLDEDPLVEGSYYPGDLLRVVLEVPQSFWGVHTDMRNLLRQIVFKAKELLVPFEKDEAHLLRETLAKAHDVLRE